MARASEPPSPLVLAAQELEDELRRCEKAVEEASRLRLNSEKNIGRAANALKTASADRERMAGKVQALLAAINAANGRMQDVAARMEARAVEIQSRMARLEALHAGTADIGAAVRELTEFAKGVKDARQLLERMAPVEERVGRAFEEARADGFEDVARDVAGMRDLLASMRKKLQSL
jgi:chromosome segregation ATPase